MLSRASARLESLTSKSLNARLSRHATDEKGLLKRPLRRERPMATSHRSHSLVDQAIASARSHNSAAASGIAITSPSSSSSSFFAATTTATAA